MAAILDGKKLSDKIREHLKNRVSLVKNRHDITPCLATILVGSDPASATYVKMKGKACESIGLSSKKVELNENTTTEELLDVIGKLNSDAEVFGILLQHPVPKQIDERACFDRILPEKDVDGVTTLGFGKLSLGQECFAACTPAGIMRLLDEYKIPIEGKHAVIIGRSPILGKPMSMMLLNRNATVTICHSKTKDLADIVSTGDIVVAALGKPEFVKGQWLKEGSVLIDAGYNKGNVGDAHYASCEKRTSHITPVPGGVGPMTITMLLSHTVLALEKNYQDK